MATPMAVQHPDVVDIPLPQPVPLRQLLPWVLFVGILLLTVLYFIGVDQGALSLVGGHWVHEFVHDARHTLAVPCH